MSCKGRDVKQKQKPMQDANFLTHQLSFYPPGIGKPSSQTPYCNGTLNDLYGKMNSMELFNLTRELRDIKDEKQQKMFKQEKLPFVTFSGTFSRRDANHLIEHSGMLCFDFDHLNGPADVSRVRSLLLADPHFETEMMFTSPRGNGVKWVTSIDLSRANHERWYRCISYYLQTQLQLDPDPMPKNVASACFICFDSNLYINNPQLI